MQWKDWVYALYVRVDRVKGLLMLAVLIANNSILIASLIAWRGVSPWVTVPVVALTLGLLMVGFAILWFDAWEMHVAEQRANAALNPTQVWQMLPWQEIEWRTRRIPEIRLLRDLARQEGFQDRAQELDESLEWLERWVELGYVPRDDMDELAPHLLDHYTADQGERL